jgi:hypothetical protein
MSPSTYLSTDSPSTGLTASSTGRTASSTHCPSAAALAGPSWKDEQSLLALLHSYELVSYLAIAIDVVGSESDNSDANSYVLPLISISYSVEFFQHKIASGMHNVITKALSTWLLKGDGIEATPSSRSVVSRTLGVVYSIANKNDSAEVD